MAGSAIAYEAPANADVPPASPSTVATRLGAGNIPAAFVVLVDVSDSMSMSQGGLYHQVYIELPKFLTALAKQDPQDQVAVIVFGNRNDTHTIKPMGPPTPDIPLPPDATHDIGTDLGYAFQLALGDLGKVPKNIQLGGVLVLSDGGLFAPDDPTYDGHLGYSAPGWAALRTQLKGVGIPVTGYALPLTRNRADVANLDKALTSCFGPHQETLSSDFSNLSSQFETQDVLKSRVAVAAGPDSGQGLKVTWHGPTTDSGALRLDLPSGSADLSVSLATRTRRVPLRVSDLSIKTDGFPADVTATISASDIALQPGRPVSLPVHLSWPPVTRNSPVAQGGTRSWSGRITLSGHVYSPFANAIQNYYLDKSFIVAGLTGNVSTGYLATIPGPTSLLILLLIILLPVVLVAVACAVLLRRAALHGTLTLTTAGKVSVPFTLPRRPWFSTQLDDSIKKSGVIRVSGNPFNHAMRVKLRNSTLPDGENTLLPGGRTMISGLTIAHEQKKSQPSGHVPESPGYVPEPSGAPDFVPEPPDYAPEPPSFVPEPPEPSSFVPEPPERPGYVPRSEPASPDTWL
jgi:hypothetical protein